MSSAKSINPPPTIINIYRRSGSQRAGAITGFAIFLFLALFTHAQSPVTFWNGAASEQWFNPGNWSNGIPDDNDSVRFNSSPIRTTLNLAGAGTAPLASLSFTSGGTAGFTITNGILRFNNNGEINLAFDAPEGVTQTVQATTRFDGFGRITNESLSNALLNVGAVTFSGSSAASLTVRGAGAILISGVISDAAQGGFVSLNKSGNGTLSLASANTFTGGVSISGGVTSVSTMAALGESADEAANLILNGGTLRFTGASGGPTNRLFTLGSAGGTLDASGTAGLTFGGTLAISFTTPGVNTTLNLTGSGVGVLSPAIGNNAGGASNLVKSGAGSWSLNGTNTFTGPVDVQQGTLWLAKTGAGGIDADYIISSGATLAIGSGRSDSVAIGSLSGSGTVTASRAFAAGETNTLIVGGDGTSTEFAGALQDSAQILALTKTGAGTLTLSNAASSFTGQTLVEDGTLRLNGNLTGTSVTVTDTGRLDGNGLLGEFVEITSGGTLAPGTSVGALSTGNAEFAGNGVYDWEIAAATGAPGSGYDLLKTTGGLSITANTGSKFTINVLPLGPLNDFDSMTNYTWTLVETGTGLSGFNASFFELNTGLFPSGGGSFEIASFEGNLVLNFLPVPEANVLSMSLMGLALMAWKRRRRIIEV